MEKAKDKKRMAQINYSNGNSIEMNIQKDDRPKYTYTLEEAVEKTSESILV